MWRAYSFLEGTAKFIYHHCLNISGFNVSKQASFDILPSSCSGLLLHLLCFQLLCNLLVEEEGFNAWIDLLQWTHFKRWGPALWLCLSPLFVSQFNQLRTMPCCVLYCGLPVVSPSCICFFDFLPLYLVFQVYGLWCVHRGLWSKDVSLWLMLHLLTISVFQYIDSAAAWLEMHLEFMARRLYVLLPM